MSVNLFGDHSSFAPNIQNIRDAFDGRVLELPEIDAGNRIVLAFKGPLLDVTARQFLLRAEEVESKYGLTGRRWATELLSTLPGRQMKIGRASSRERLCTYV